MEDLQLEVTKKLVEINTIKISPESPFTWASGWKSPIYCDNRKVLSYPAVRTFIAKRFAELIREKYPQAEVIAGVATGAIAHGVLVAEELGLPFVYVRSKPKDHGLENLIEGDLTPDQKVVIIEDLVSTGVSSLKAAEAIRNFGGDVLGMLAIFTYNFTIAKENFEEANIELTTLSKYQNLLELALSNGDITEDQKQDLDSWRIDPANWGR
ncbi:orotate phosphoribosyltransferase [Halosquirtibacter xylanolyticus]|uniref:orotate phosphoribosyltransferase n=1 Tax=Halosquirtibacter xylanolyticus TaxID=3374599 RepID=UPI003747BC20|nr:orotate phosphoribosyltransferase [Prolixibacteraceae bacterium]